MKIKRKISYHVPIRTGIINQLQESTCIDITLADMCTIIFRMNGVFLAYDLTPQIGIDRNGGISASIRMCMYKDYGLEELSVYPYSTLTRNITKDEDWTKEDMFETHKDLRYRLEYIAWITDTNLIEPMLLTMYDCIGFRYPVVGIMFMGPFEDPDVARFHADKENPPYRHAPGVDLPDVRHALLIVGIYTMSDNMDDHYCLVKNSFGKKWGSNGESRVAIDVFVEILVPTQPRSTTKKRTARKRKRNRDDKITIGPTTKTEVPSA